MRMLVLVLGLCSLPFLFVAYAIVARFALHGPVTRESLSVSVGRVSGSVGELLGDDNACRRRSAGVWRCEVADSEGSGGGVVYRVRMRTGSSCWSARLVRDGSEQGMPRDISGCVRRWQWSLL